jgi:hypothetical protein
VIGDGAWEAWQAIGLALLGVFGLVRGWSLVKRFI